MKCARLKLATEKGPLKQLLNAAEQRPSEDFWITMGEYVQSLLLAKLEP